MLTLQSPSRILDTDPLAFLVVCGLPRSGTRQFTDILNQHPAISVQGEISLGLIPKIRDILLYTEKTYRGRKAFDVFQRKRARLAIEIVSGLSQSNRIGNNNARIVGFKTPRAERHYKAIRDITGNSFIRLHYIFCIRRISDCYLSLSSMPWFKKSENQFIDMYIKSLLVAARIKDDALPKENISYAYLNEFVESSDKGSWIENTLFDPISIHTQKGDGLRFLSGTSNVNSTVSYTGKQKNNEFSKETLDLFSRRSLDIANAIDLFNKKFNASIPYW